jgi:hypothetical protein
VPLTETAYWNEAYQPNASGGLFNDVSFGEQAGGAIVLVSDVKILAGGRARN